MTSRNRPLLSGPIGIVTTLLLAALSAVAQQPPTATPATADTSQLHKTKGNEKEKANPNTGTSNDRLFYALPNFLTVQNTNLPPMTARQKFKAVVRSSFDYVQYPWYAFQAGLDQAQNSEPGYGQGAAGYAKRYGAGFADGTLENFMTGAVLPSLLRQDPRFYQTSNGTFLHRTGYAISRIFIIRTDSGGEQFNFSEVVGAGLSAGISTYSYHPRGDRNLGNAATVWGTLVGWDTVTIVVKEFWPDIQRKLSHKTPQHETLVPASGKQ